MRKTNMFKFVLVATAIVLTVCHAAEGDSSENLPGLPRVFKISETMRVGYEPIGNQGFETLKYLGIKTIISVDGATPDVAAAEAAGMKYVHIPFGYDGVPLEAQRAIYKVMKEMPGPYYFHCHHGQHRGPAAAAIALRIKSGCAGDEALGVLKKCGTGKDYEGLWKSVSEYRLPQVSDQLPELHAISPVDNMAQAMAKMDRTWDRIVQLHKNGWKSLSDHPDITAEHEALILGELLRTSARLNVNRKEHEDLWLRLKEAEKVAFDLRDAIKSGSAKSSSERFEEINANCNSCHKLYRNNSKQSRHSSE